ncbi:MAG: hypothetical protein OEV91_11400 [Desulfobulbaceae bacterium]|nr:hypothetical protein [Desulfobulbaceae bacterium]
MEDFYSDIEENGYHIFSRTCARIKGFYPNQFPDYPGVRLKDLKVDDHITIRAFFPVGSGATLRVDGGYIDLEVEHIDSDHLFGVILTELPEGFALETGSSLEIREDEILYKTESQVH